MPTEPINFRVLFKQSYRLLKPFFTEEKRFFAWALLLILISLMFAEVFIHVLLASWSQRFFDALQNFDKSSFLKEILVFTYLAFSYVALGLTKFFTQSRYLLKWREYMTDNFINKWLGDYSFYGLKLLKKEVDNPDQRISQDISEFTETFLSLLLGLLDSLTTLCSFIVILWNLSYVFTVDIFGHNVKIYGSFVWIALIYSGIGTYFTQYLGAPLSSLLFTQEKNEATFRFSLIRVRENAEPIAFYKAINFEKIILLRNFAKIVENAKRVINKGMQISILVSVYGQISYILPYLFTFALFFSKNSAKYSY